MEVNWNISQIVGLTSLWNVLWQWLWQRSDRTIGTLLSATQCFSVHWRGLSRLSAAQCFSVHWRGLSRVSAAQCIALTGGLVLRSSEASEGDWVCQPVQFPLNIDGGRRSRSFWMKYSSFEVSVYSIKLARFTLADSLNKIAQIPDRQFWFFCFSSTPGEK